MKTPREVLLAHHQAANPKLDALRGEFIATLASDTNPKAPVREGYLEKSPRVQPLAFPTAARPAWLRFMGLLRWHFAGLSAAWVVILLLNHGPSSVASSTLAQQSPASSPQLLMSLRENRRQIVELTSSPASEPAPALPATQPQRRSEGQAIVRIA